jgi:hypothetical protein
MENTVKKFERMESWQFGPPIRVSVQRLDAGQLDGTQ